MTSPTNLDDLRASLTAHADAFTESVTDAEAAGRSASLHTRIRRARNRRRGALAGGVAAVVLVAGGVYAAATLPDSHHSSQPIIAGHTLDKDVDVTGFSYRLAETAQSTPGQQRFTLRLPKVAQDRVIELVSTGLGSGTATLRDGDTDLARASGGSRVARPVPVGSDKHDVTVVLHDAGKDAQVGLAVYDRDQTLPPGIADGTAVFRQNVGASSLVGGAWAQPGQSSLSFTVTGPVKRWRLSDACSLPGSKPSMDVMLDEKVDGKPFAGTGCDTLAERDLDPGTGGSQPDHWPLGPGTHTVTLRLVGHKGHPVNVAGAVFGAAVYRLSAQKVVQGMPVDLQIEANGRDWLLDQVIPADNAQITGPAYVDAVVGPGDWRPVGQHLTAGDRDMEIAGTTNQTGSVGEPELGEVLAGSTYRFWLKHPRDPAAKATILVYRPAG